MSTTQNFLVTLSLISWFGVILYEFITNREKKISFGIQFLLIFIVAYFLNRYFGYFETIEFKSGLTISEGWILWGLYLFTLLGIFGHHVFVQIKGLKERGKQRKLRWMPILKPLIISPLIFLAVLNQLEQISVHANSLKVIITQFILAFQNGFFWKTVIEQLEKK